LLSRLLITGPPASGKSRAALDRFLAIPASLLIVPSATMSEHVAHELARAGVAVRPSRIQTLARFLDMWSGVEAAPAALLGLMVDQALERVRPERFAEVARFSGFRDAVGGVLEEAPLGIALPPDLAELRATVAEELLARGAALRNARLLRAAANVRALGALSFDHVAFDGFFSFSTAEMALIEALAERASVTVTLPDWTGSERMRHRLVNAGFEELGLTDVHRSPAVSSFAAPAIDRECEDIARRILEHAARGRSFREMGVILRSRLPYGPALETTFARFGIPSRQYFADSVSANAHVQFISGLVGAMLGGWDHEEVLRLVRMPASGLGATAEGDRIDFALRKRLPGRGLPVPEIPAPLSDYLRTLDSWRRDKRAPEEWAARVSEFARNWIELEDFDRALTIAASALGDTRVTLAEFWPRAERALALETLRVRDRRSNVVHVMDVYEARQWELKIAFVCGLNERVFPQYHREDPLGVNLRTLDELAEEERLLFQVATSRATEETVLSYARFDERGRPLLPSFFLGGRPFLTAGGFPGGVAPRPRPQAGQKPGCGQEWPPYKHTSLSASSIESFLQCPFLFFASKTLKLEPRPPAPRDRLDVLLQGNILHDALASIVKTPLFAFDAAFDDACRRHRIPPGYRTEAVRLELLANFNAFLEDQRIPIPPTARVEEKFELTLSSDLKLRGRIDRIDIPTALVIDYKYSAANRIKERFEDTESGDSVQAGLYLLAAERVFRIKPAGVLFCGLRQEVTWAGWHTSVPGLEKIGTRITPDGLTELRDAAVEAAIRVQQEIAAGRIAPEPKSLRKCEWCDFRDICRIESAAAARKAGS
jgi:hypothetical protein